MHPKYNVNEQHMLQQTAITGRLLIFEVSYIPVLLVQLFPNGSSDHQDRSLGSLD